MFELLNIHFQFNRTDSSSIDDVWTILWRYIIDKLSIRVLDCRKDRKKSFLVLSHLNKICTEMLFTEHLKISSFRMQDSKYTTIFSFGKQYLQRTTGWKPKLPSNRFPACSSKMENLAEVEIKRNTKWNKRDHVRFDRHIPLKKMKYNEKIKTKVMDQESTL